MKKKEIKTTKETPLALPIAGKSVEDYAALLLSMGFTEDMLSKIRPQHIIQMQKLLIDKEKAKNQENALKLTLMRFMAGTLGRPEFVDKEEKRILEPLPVVEKVTEEELNLDVKP